MRKIRVHFIDGLSLHVRHRGSNHMTIFHQTADYEVYLALTRIAARRADVDVHGFALMGTHTHLLVTPRASEALPRMMQILGARYARYYNRAYQRIGPLWNGRYSASLIDTERYWLTCLRYIEQNPVRAVMVLEPQDYRWSSYAAHAFGNKPDWLVEHPVYQGLGQSGAARQVAYRALCGEALTKEELALSRSAMAVRAGLAMAG